MEAIDKPEFRARRRYSAGAELSGEGVSFRIWAPEHERVSVVIEQAGEYSLQKEESGYFSALVSGIGAGARYRFRIGSGIDLFPDPASHWQPDGPQGASVVADPAAYMWRDTNWKGVEAHGQVLYEMHVGTFTREGTWRAAQTHLPKLAQTGVTVIEMMPVNEFCGRFGWGYDGVQLYAPTHLYGTPDDLKHFIDAAHAEGIGVILDVVYNHLGPGSHFEAFSASYFTDRYKNEWGKPINFDGPDAMGARDYFAENAGYWIREFHFDGLRVDATQSLYDASDDHIIARIAREARRAAGDRKVLLVGESEPQHAGTMRPQSKGGYGLDTLWNDDFHHSAVVMLTGRNEAYYHDHRGAPQEFVAAAKFGHLFQGQRYDWQDKGRGTPSFDLAAASFVNFIENHDQLANSGRGLRTHSLTSPARARAMTALLLLAPQTPMLFQGQEFWASSPFLFFAEQGPDLDPLVTAGRHEFVSQFPSLKDKRMEGLMAVPCDPDTFNRCKLDWSEFAGNAEVVALHSDLLRLRREEAAIARQPTGRRGEIDGSVIGPEAFLLRFFGEAPGEERLLIVNFGQDLPIHSIPDPLFAPPEGMGWSVLWSSEDPAYGGAGQRPVDTARRWVLSADTALLFRPAPRSPQVEREDLSDWQAFLSP